jgi:hypothetical protein
MPQGVFNSLPLIITGPLIFAGLKMASVLVGLGWHCICKCAGVPASLSSNEAGELVKRVLDDGSGSWGMGAALDCQQCLSPLYARPKLGSSSSGSSGGSGSGGELSAETAYRAIDVPVSLWYGTADSTVPLGTAEWLRGLLPADTTTAHYVDAGHGLYVTDDYAEQVLDDLVGKMEAGVGGSTTNAQHAGERARLRVKSRVDPGQLQQASSILTPLKIHKNRKHE